jgi:UDP-3-O-[3-hydroxymyristoyl] glucosamine N-acyltransferase
VIEAGASVGAGTVVRSGAYVGPNVRIGEDCVIWSNVVIRAGSVLGDRVIIHPNTTIGADGFGYIFREGRHKKVPQTGGVVIEDDVEIGAGCAVDRAKTGATRIGLGTKIDNLCQIGHNVRIGRHCVIAGGAGIGGSCTFGDYCAIGGQVGISDHVTLETGARVAAMSGVSRRVMPGETVRGIPAVNNKDFQQTSIAGRRLPEMMKAFATMQRRVDALEAELERRAGAERNGAPEPAPPEIV